MRDLERDTLADLQTLMSLPPGLRIGHTRLLTGQPNPVAGANYSYPISADYWERVMAIYAVLTTSATAGTRVPSLAYVNADGLTFSAVPLEISVGPSTTQVLSVDVWGSNTPLAAPSATGEGAVTNPGAGAAIASTPVVQPGTYTVTGTVYVSGTVTGADGNNMKVSGTGSQVEILAYPGVANAPVPFSVVITTTAAGAITVAAVGAASGAAAVYDAVLVATPVATGTVRTVIPAMICKSGWQVQLNVAGIAAGDQLSGIAVLSERYPSNWADGALGSDEERQARDLAAAIADTIRGPW